MIKALVTGSPAPPYVVLGLSDENVTRLMADESILLDLADLGLPSLKIVIMGGRTESDIVDALATLGIHAS